ncbi:MAG: hypothetical protein IPH30_07270 [Betaproteobacteria bacterium]|nr:hypothetical protein [Betaproteobacteria bacterium]
MRRLKTAASEPLPDSIRDPLATLLLHLQSHGLFVVPVGDLEEWLSAYGIQASKQNKWAWANEAASLVKRLNRQSGDVWDFILCVGDYLNTRLNKLE